MCRRKPEMIPRSVGTFHRAALQNDPNNDFVRAQVALLKSTAFYPIKNETNRFWGGGNGVSGRGEWSREAGEEIG